MPNTQTRVPSAGTRTPGRWGVSGRRPARRARSIGGCTTRPFSGLTRRLPGALIRVLAVAAALAGTTRTVATPPAKRLSTQLARDATLLVSSDPLLMHALKGAILLAREAAALDPEDPDNWRLVLQIGDLAERPDLQQEAIGHLIELEPQDDVIRLRYIHTAIDRRQTVEDKVSLYEQLLSPPARQKLGPAISSRIAADYAVLLERIGDVEGFGRLIADAVATDPANREAAATAAGFFRLNVTEPFAEAELLVTALMADPVAVGTQVALARLLLEHGAYQGADRLYRMATRYYVAGRQNVQGGLIADWALAQWGRGQPEAALATVQQRQREIDDVHRRNAKLQNLKLTPLDLAKLPPAPLSATLAIVRAAIHQRRGDEQAGPAYRAAMTAYDAEISALKAEEKPDAAALAARHHEAAWVAVWIGSDVAHATGYLEAARALMPDQIAANAQARFDGWIALRKGELDRAATLLEPLADEDSAGRLGWAMTLLAQGHRAQAAWHLLTIVRNRPGSLVGIWCADVLAEIVGVRPGPTVGAERLESLVASVPHVMDRFADEPTLAFSIRVQPAKLTFAPFEPIIVNLEITNNAPFPLSISSGGPIRPHVALFPEVRVARNPGIGAVPPQIVSIDRRLTLEPNERFVIPVDLRRGDLFKVLNRLPLPGATLKVRAVCNFRATPSGNVRAGVLGSQIDSPPFRVDGARVDGHWISEAMAAALEPHSRDDLSAVALLGHTVARFGERGNVARTEVQRAAADGLTALQAAYEKLDPISQAWLICVWPNSPVLESLRAVARTQDHRLIRLAYILHCLRGVNDPALQTAEGDSDPAVRGVAALMREGLNRASRAAQSSRGG